MYLFVPKFVSFHGRTLCILAFFFLLLSTFAWAFIGSPSDFVPNTRVTIQNGQTVKDAGNTLYNANIISHPRLFYIVVRISGKSSGVRAGLYQFDEPQNLVSVAYRLINGITGTTDVRITFTEGESVTSMAKKVSNIFPNISSEEFITFAKPHEGYLFPDTYQFQPGVQADGVVKEMLRNFDTRILPVMGIISASGRTLSEIIIMASLIEKEARGLADKKAISGILWNRIGINMPLQVDAVFGYIYDRQGYSPTFDDLVIDSPYNTYTRRGLPPGPISNPGIDSIIAAAEPDTTDYFYYLTGNDGQMYYARTFDEHKRNRARHLD